MTDGDGSRGYGHRDYAYSLAEFGQPRELPRCGGWLLERPIPGFPLKDAMGCYPLFACQDWTRLHEDLDRVRRDFVSLVLVADTFSEATQDDLRRSFDLVKPYKTHYISDLSRPLEESVSRHHRRYVRRALKDMDVEECSRPAQYLDDWVRLYAMLICRHSVRGINAFSAHSFRIQLGVPGMMMFLGRRGSEVVGATLVLVHGRVAYFHLSACTPVGYELRASYGIHWKALAFLQGQGVRYFDHGGMAGTQEDPQDGLAEFKRGWSNDRRIVYLCGCIFDRAGYDEIVRISGVPESDYFPRYRLNEAK